jgi:hypothetical protein
MCEADEYYFQQSKQKDNTHEFVCLDKQFNYILDSNGTSYASQQILIDATAMGTYNKFTSVAESFITIPLRMTLTPNNNFGAAFTENDFALSLKNGIQHILNSMTIKINDNQINNPTPNSNEEISWRLLKMSADERHNYQDIINYALDSPDTVRYNATGSALGLGETNNAIKAVLFDPALGYGNNTSNVNTGRLERMKTTSYNPDTLATVQWFTNAAQAKAGWISHVSTNSITTLIYDLYAIIPLPVLHPVFSEIGLCRGMKLNITLNCNTGSRAVIGVNAGATYVTAGTNITTPNGVLPFQISPIGAGLTLGNTVTSLTAELNIKNTVTSCRLYLSQYTLTPKYEAEYIKNPKKKITYTDYQTYSFNNIEPGAAINNLLTNGISKLRYFLMVPHLSATSNGALGFGAPASPFSSSPATTCPYSKITNFQLNVAGKNIFETPQNYSFETFMEQVRPALSINGGSMNSLGLSSGSISKKMWESGYTYYYVDLSRNNNADEDAASKSIQVLFNNSGSKTIDYHIIVGYEKHFYININTGQYTSE